MSEFAEHMSIPGSLLAEIVDKISVLKGQINNEYEDFGKGRPVWRERLMLEGKIQMATLTHDNGCKVLAVDGAFLTDSDRINTYVISCCNRVGDAKPDYAQSACFALLPHTADAGTIALGLMTMQEIMLAVETVEEMSGAFCLIDGSRVAALINIVNFYSPYRNQNIEKYLDRWRLEPDSEPGRTIAKFESRNWFETYLRDSHLVAIAKMVVSGSLVAAYAKEALGRLDDKAFASLVLEVGESIEERLKKPARDYFDGSLYPFAEGMNALCNDMAADLSSDPEPAMHLMNPDSLMSQIMHVYYKPDEVHGVCKLEMNRLFLSDRKRLGALLSWLKTDLSIPDILEPVNNFIADRIAKEAVKAGKNMLRSIKRNSLSAGEYIYADSYRS